MTNRRNRTIYRLWAPLYDAALERFFAPGRSRALRLLAPRRGERVLLVGVGTGSDLLLLPEGVTALGVDLSPEMLARARSKLPPGMPGITLAQADGQALPVRDGECDAVVLNLILSVVPDPAACLRASLRALKPGGRAVVFDKFRPDGEPLSSPRRLLNVVTTFFGTDITRSFGEVAAGTGWRVVHQEPSVLGGAYRILLLAADD